MRFPYNPFDWYWIVGGNGPHIDTPDDEFTGDASKVYSSARDKYVPSSDATYTTWLASQMDLNGDIEPTTRIDTQANLKAVLQGYGLNPKFGV